MNDICLSNLNIIPYKYVINTEGNGSLIRLFVMDVDGTLTDGGIYYDDCGHEMKKFNVKDGIGIKKLRDYGVNTMILTGRKSNCVIRRAEELKIDYVIQGIEDKALYLKDFMKKNNLDSKDIAYIGDDINDFEIMQLVGNTACPADAVENIKKVVNIVCSLNGGQGVVREYIEYILREDIGE